MVPSGLSMWVALRGHSPIDYTADETDSFASYGMKHGTLSEEVNE